MYTPFVFFHYSFSIKRMLNSEFVYHICIWYDSMISSVNWKKICIRDFFKNQKLTSCYFPHADLTVNQIIKVFMKRNFLSLVKIIIYCISNKVEYVDKKQS